MIKNNTLLIAAGGAGNNSLQEFVGTDISVDYLHCSSHYTSIKQSKITNYIYVKPRVFKRRGLNFSLPLRTKKTLSNIVSDYSRVVIVVGLGGLTGSVFTREIVRLTKQLYIPVSVVAYLPFSFENKRRLIALNFLKEFQDNDIDIKPVDHSVESKKYPMISLCEYFRMIGAIAHCLIEGIKEYSER